MENIKPGIWFLQDGKKPAKQTGDADEMGICGIKI